MARRYHKKESFTEEIFKAIFGISVLYLFYLFIEYYTNRNNFWHLLIYSIIAVIVVILLVVLIVWLNAKRKGHRMTKMLSEIQKAGLGEQIDKFINRFGRGQEKIKDGWEYRGYKIDWNRINEVINDFKQKGVILSHKDFSAILRKYIDEKENNVTLKSIQSTVRELNKLNGSDFESLLQRLYEKIGYTVQLTGKVGDQGGDLVATNNQGRLLIQAKCYKNMSVGNDAVQQAVAAMKYYDCNKGAVVTTSDFTREAFELARANNIELIAKSHLQELLLKYLSESWN